MEVGNGLGQMKKSVTQIVNEQLLAAGLPQDRAIPEGITKAAASAIHMAMRTGLLPSSDLCDGVDAVEVALARVIIAFAQAIPKPD